MAQVTIKINGYSYTVGCEDGQEQHLQAMAAEVDKRIESVKALGNASGESRLLVLAALLMADELHDQAIELRAKPAAPPRSPAAKGDSARKLERLALRAEEIAADLERPPEPPAAGG